MSQFPTLCFTDLTRPTKPASISIRPGSRPPLPSQSAIGWPTPWPRLRWGCSCSTRPRLPRQLCRKTWTRMTSLDFVEASTPFILFDSLCLDSICERVRQHFPLSRLSLSHCPPTSRGLIWWKDEWMSEVSLLPWTFMQLRSSAFLCLSRPGAISFFTYLFATSLHDLSQHMFTLPSMVHMKSMTITITTAIKRDYVHTKDSCSSSSLLLSLHCLVAFESGREKKRRWRASLFSLQSLLQRLSDRQT